MCELFIDGGLLQNVLGLREFPSVRLIPVLEFEWVFLSFNYF